MAANNSRRKSVSGPPKPLGVGDAIVVADFKSNFEQNNRDHKTYGYDTDQDSIVARRNRDIRVDIGFERRINLATDIWKFSLKLGDKVVVNTRAFQFKENEIENGNIDIDNNDWIVQYVTTEDRRMTMLLRPSKTCIIGKWMLDKVTSKCKGDDSKMSIYNIGVPIYVIYNAWSPDDGAFVLEESDRQAYILNQTSPYSQFTAEQFAAVYQHSQFERSILDITLSLINNVPQVNLELLRNPIEAFKYLCFAISSFLTDDRKAKPITNFAPNSSKAIFQHFAKSNEKLFTTIGLHYSALLITATRALGIASRIVCGYRIAPYGSSFTSNIFFTQGKIACNMPEIFDDSFHWCEVCLNCSPKTTSEWQASFWAPRNDSKRYYGPITLKCLKEGQIESTKDALEIFKILNNRLIFWDSQHENKPPIYMGKIESAAYKIVTNNVDDVKVLDVTGLYKYPIESAMSQQIFDRVFREIINENSPAYDIRFFNSVYSDIEFTLVPTFNISTKDIIKILVVLLNKKDTKNTCAFVLEILGKKGIDAEKTIKNWKMEVELEPMERKTVAAINNPYDNPIPDEYKKIMVRLTGTISSIPKYVYREQDLITL